MNACNCPVRLDTPTGVRRTGFYYQRGGLCNMYVDLRTKPERARRAIVGPFLPAFAVAM